MIYRSEGEAIRRVFILARDLGIWPGYFYSALAGGWVLTFNPRASARLEYEGDVLL